LSRLWGRLSPFFILKEGTMPTQTERTDQVSVAPLDSHGVLREELSKLRQGKREPIKDPIAAAHNADLSGLSFSGGGIRSATFKLGVLQALAGLGLLDKFDYLSTVSGGGYIGSWLAAWIRRKIEEIKKILTHRGLYPVRSKPPPRAPPKKFQLDYSYSQVPAFDDSVHGDPEYSNDAYLS
jgi:hypothetical protein